MNTRARIILILVLCVALVAGAIVLSVYQVPPEEQIGRTTAMIRAARSAQAEKYAPELLEKARSDFQAALSDVETQEWCCLRGRPGRK